MTVEQIGSLAQPSDQKTGESSHISSASELVDMKLAWHLYDATENTLQVNESAPGRIVNVQVERNYKVIAERSLSTIYYDRRKC